VPEETGGYVNSNYTLFQVVEKAKLLKKKKENTW